MTQPTLRLMLLQFVVRINIRATEDKQTIDNVGARSCPVKPLGKRAAGAPPTWTAAGIADRPPQWTTLIAEQL
jgi:hypothetical protein